MRILGASLQERRRWLRLTAEQLAPLAGMTQVELRAIETGKLALTQSQLESLAQALLTTPAALVSASNRARSETEMAKMVSFDDLPEEVNR